MGEFSASVLGVLSRGARRFTEAPVKRWATAVLAVFSVLLLTSTFIYWNDVSSITREFFFKITTPESNPAKPPVKVEYYLSCTNGPFTTACPTNYPATHQTEASSTVACPDYFRWIHEDLRPWKSEGITRELLESGEKYADIRLVIIEGKAYIQMFRKSFQTRDWYTIWGILQLLRLYPGKIPHLDLMFGCGDVPMVPKRDFRWPFTKTPPPVFHYCGDSESYDIAFPDWSFWGWPEVNIRPWGGLLWGLTESNRRIKWQDREPYAYWRGNPSVSRSRRDLLKCNASDKHDWNARLYEQDWGKETQLGFKHSNLEDQCTHRYKIYIEGVAWSVSDKYILACDSMTLLVIPKYHDFFTRSLVPKQHFWPIRPSYKCKDIEDAVKWGNSNTDKAQAIGQAGSRFIREDLRMDFVYDFMFHLLSEYAKLLRYKPTVPPRAFEVCSETMACPENGLYRQYMDESLVRSPKDTPPCTMPSQ